MEHNYGNNFMEKHIKERFLVGGVTVMNSMQEKHYRVLY
jgi:hypothetical protein